MPVVRNILDFLELRPIFTMRLAQVIWWLYIAERMYFTPWGFYRVVTASGPASPLYSWFEAFFTPFRVLPAQLFGHFTTVTMMTAFSPGLTSPACTAATSRSES